MWSAAESLFARMATFGPRTALAEDGHELTYDGLLAAVASRSRHLLPLPRRRVRPSSRSRLPPVRRLRVRPSRVRLSRELPVSLT